MGFKWSFFLAQLAHAYQLSEAIACKPGAVLQDQAPPPNLRHESKAAMLYCDNLFIAGGILDPATRLARSSCAFEGHVAGDGPSLKKGWKINQLREWLLERPMVSGRCLKR